MSSQRNEVINQLRDGGWTHDRTAGSHSIYKHPSRKALISVPNDGHATNPRVFTAILCQIKNGTKFERSQFGFTTTPQKEPVVSSISAATKENVMKAMSQKANPPSAPTLPFVVAKGLPRGRTGKAKMKFSDEQILSAATIFEEGGTLVKAARALRCSGPTAKHCLITFFGEEPFNRLFNMTPKERRKATKEKAKAARRVLEPVAPAMNKIIATALSTPAEAPELPNPALAFLATDVAEARCIEPPFHLSDIRTMNVTIVAGLASVELTMKMNSPSFQTLCKWSEGK